MSISFKTTPSDAQLIGQIADRACTVWPEGDRLNFEMDLTATHASGCPLKLAELLAADNFNFSHDVAGIYQHLDRPIGWALSPAVRLQTISRGTNSQARRVRAFLFWATACVR